MLSSSSMSSSFVTVKLHSVATSLTILLKLGWTGYSNLAAMSVVMMANLMRHGAFLFWTAKLTRYRSLRLAAR